MLWKIIQIRMRNSKKMMEYKKELEMKIKVKEYKTE